MFTSSTREQIDFLRAAIKEQGQNPDEVMANEGYDFNINSAPLAMAARIVRLVSKDFLELRRYARENLQNTSFAFTVPVMFGSKPDTVRVFTNISMTGTATDDTYKFCNPFFCYEEVIPNFLAQLKADLADERRAQAWATTNRAWRRLKRYEEMTIARAVSRFSNAKELGIGDHLVRNMSQFIEDMRRPLEITYADKPEDFLTMYGSGPGSCMFVNQNGDPDHNSKNWRTLLINNHCPTSFFAYHPHTRGAFITRGNRVVARCIVYETRKGWCYGRVYPTGDTWSAKLVKMLEEAGMTELSKGFARECSFTIPGLKHDTREEWHAPMPYFDNLVGSFDIRFDQKTKEFYITHYERSSDGNYSNTDSTTGYISSRHYASLACDHCGHSFHPDNAIHSSTDDRIFCSEDHARAAGLVQAYRNDGSSIWTVRTPDMYETVDNYIFTNRRAAEARCTPFQETVLEENEYADLSFDTHYGICRDISTNPARSEFVNIGVAANNTNRGTVRRMCLSNYIRPEFGQVRVRSVSINAVRTMKFDPATLFDPVPLIVDDGVAPVAAVEWLAPMDGIIPVAVVTEFTSVVATHEVRIAA
jgi:hypothetical protein